MPLAVLGFGDAQAWTRPPQGPFAALDMPPLRGPALVELWTTDRPVSYHRFEDIDIAATEDVLFGCLACSVASSQPLERATYDAYDRILRILDRSGYNYLLRVWNYLPAINGVDEGMERYQRFTLGRHEAYLAHRRAVETAPAASAVGSRSGSLTVLFAGAKNSGTPLENPRQVSAYRYPRRYGPRSPTFSRATISRLGGGAQLYISGTASIVGHESVHPDDPVAQLDEAWANVKTLLAGARAADFPDAPLILKTYLKHPHHLASVENRFSNLLRPIDQIVFIEAELCRPELLVEIEGFCLSAEG